MRTEYAVEIYDKHRDRFVRQIDVFSTYEEAVSFTKTANIEMDEDSECLHITEIEYADGDATEIGINSHIQKGGKRNDGKGGKGNDRRITERS